MLAIPGLLTKTTPEFRTSLVQMASKLGLDPSFIAAVMSRESGFNPQAVNPFTKATGLIQFMPNTAKILGTTVEALFGMTAIGQLFFVEKYFKPFAAKLKTPGDYYMAVFMPAHIGKPRDFVLFRKGEKGYEQNAGLDLDKDGVITVGDVTRAIETTVERARSQPEVHVDAPKAEPASSSPLQSPGRPVSSSGGQSVAAELPVLRLGSSGSAVELFRALTIGGSGPLDAIDIEKSVKVWQRHKGLKDDGVIGNKEGWPFIIKMLQDAFRKIAERELRS